MILPPAHPICDRAPLFAGIICVFPFYFCVGEIWQRCARGRFGRVRGGGGEEVVEPFLEVRSNVMEGDGGEEEHAAL